MRVPIVKRSSLICVARERIHTQPTALFTLPGHRIICSRLPEFIERDAIRNKWKLRSAVLQTKTRGPHLTWTGIYGPVSRTSW